MRIIPQKSPVSILTRYEFWLISLLILRKNAINCSKKSIKRNNPADWVDSPQASLTNAQKTMTRNADSANSAYGKI